MEYYKELRKYVGHMPLILPGAVVIIVNSSGEILLEERRDGFWGLPGGLMELGESFIDTARREVAEETGLSLGELQLVDIFSGSNCYCKVSNGDELYSVTAVYTTTEYEGTLAIDQSESRDMKFFRLDRLPFGIGQGYQDHIESYVKMLGRYPDEGKYERPLYDHIGVGYDTTRKADPEITRRLQNHLQVYDKRPVVDIACGSGNYTLALHHLGLNICGTDVSAQMIESAGRKSNEVEWYLADVKNMPFTDGQFYGAVCTLAIHHFGDLTSSFREIFRILRPGGRLVIFTSSPEQMQRYWLNEYFPNMMNKSIAQMPSTAEVEGALVRSGFQLLGYESFMIQPNLQDLFLYSGKYRPEIYLQAEVRKGISSFASLAHEDEVREGVKRLEEDIRSGGFKQKSGKYISERGDYLYVVAEKPEPVEESI